MSKLAFVKVEHKKDGVQKAVKKAMQLAHWKKHIKGKKIFIKINGVSDQLIPGQCTSPWVIDAVLSRIRNEFPKAEVTMGDANLPATEQLNGAAKLWGFLDLAKKYNVKFINLSEVKLAETDVGGKVLKNLPIPKLILDADCIVNLPVAKTHCLTTITCCLKNHLGIIPRFRHQYHLVINQSIADINRFSKKTVFNIVDATVCMEGNAPRNGIPIIGDAIFAGNDRVAIDTAVAKFMGFDPNKIKHLQIAEKMGVGTGEYEIVGDKFQSMKFKPAEINKQPTLFCEMSLRKVPFLNTVIFKTRAFNLFAWLATQYNTRWWYNLYGKKYAEEIINNTWYGNEFKELWQRTGCKGKI